MQIPINSLVNKQLITTPKNWTDWLERWEVTNDPLALMSLLHLGPEMPNAGINEYEAQVSAVRVYMSVAQSYYDRRRLFGEELEYGQHASIFTCPRHILAKTAFQTLCKHAFEVTESDKTPWIFFTSNEALLADLISFLGADSLEIRVMGDQLHSWFIHIGKERYKDILENFCLGLAEFLIEIPSENRVCREDIERYKAVWRSHRGAAIKILLYLGRLDILIKHMNKVDDSVLGPLKKFILDHEIELPVREGSRETKYRKPKSVAEVIESCSGTNYWYHGGLNIAQAAVVYLGLTAGRE